MTLCIEEKEREGTPKAEKEHLQVLGKNMGGGGGQRSNQSTTSAYAAAAFDYCSAN